MSFAAIDPTVFPWDGAIFWSNDYMLFCHDPILRIYNWNFTAGPRPLNMSGSAVAVGDGEGHYCVVFPLLSLVS